MEQFGGNQISGGSLSGYFVYKNVKEKKCLNAVNIVRFPGLVYFH